MPRMRKYSQNSQNFKLTHYRIPHYFRLLGVFWYDYRSMSPPVNSPRIAHMRLIVLGLIVALGLPTALQAAPTTQPSTQPVLVPYRLTDTNHILIRVKINGQGPFNFIMDTGAPTMFVRIPVGKKLGLKVTRGMATLDQLEVEGGAKLTHIQCAVQTPFQIEGMNAIGATDVDLDGLLGYLILAHFRLQIDLSKDRMVWTPLNFTPRPLANRREVLGDAPDPDEDRLEATGSLLKVLGPLIKHPQLEAKYRGLLGIELAASGNTVSALRVLGDSPADKAGVVGGDQLIEIDSHDVKSIADAQDAVQAVRPGQAVSVLIQRGAARLKLKITSGEGL